MAPNNFYGLILVHQGRDRVERDLLLELLRPRQAHRRGLLHRNRLRHRPQEHQSGVSGSQVRS